MNTIELGECTQLRARISEAQCHKNRKQGVIYACKGCPGLTGITPVNASALVPDRPAPAAAPSAPSVPSVPSVPCGPSAPSVPALALTFQGDNLAVIRRFEQLSRHSGGNLEDDLCTIIDLYLDGQLQFRKAS